MNKRKPLYTNDVEVGIDEHQKTVSVYTPVDRRILHELSLNMAPDEDEDDIMERFWNIYEEDVRESFRAYGYDLIRS